MTGFRPFFNPATGEWIEYTAIAQDTSGELVRFNWVQNRMLPPLWALAKAVGVRPYHRHWDSQT